MLGYAKNLNFDVVSPQLKIMSQLQLFMHMAEEAANHLGFSKDLLYQFLLEEERKSTSYVGDGVAIPDLKIQGIKRPFLILVTMAHGLEFNAADRLPVNLACLVLSPESDGPYHLRRLSRVSRFFKNDDLRKKLGDAEDEVTIRSLLINSEGWMMAA